MGRKLKVLMVVVVLAAAGGGYAYVRAQKAAVTESAAATATIETGSIDETVTAQGTLEPKEYVDVGVQVSGQLQKLHVGLGDVVQAGALLAEIDPEIYESRVRADQARLKTLQAQIAQQQAQLALSRQQHKRNEQLITSNAISQDAFDSSKTVVAVAEAQLAALQAQLQEAQSTLEGDQANLGYAKIYAPMTGTVVVQDIREGQTLNASQQSPTLMRLANLDVMTVRAEVAEADVMRITPGMAVSFKTLGSSERKWQGTVRQVLPSPEVVNEVVLYNVLVDVDNSDHQLMTGMSAQMFFAMGSAKDVPLVPVSALGKRVADQDKDGGEAYMVRKIVNGKPVETVIHIGLMDRTVAEVKDGLAAGDAVSITALPPAAGQKMPRTMPPRI